MVIWRATIPAILSQLKGARVVGSTGHTTMVDMGKAHRIHDCGE
jgi:hypothetical protein